MEERGAGVGRLTRRGLLSLAVAAAAACVLPRRAGALGFELPQAARDALAASPLVYVCPLRGAGEESACHAEVWFVQDGADVLVVTAAERWKARAVRRGLARARLWVGDFGVWTRSGGTFKGGPTFVAKGSFDADPATRERALAAYAKKYPEKWGQWGPRFRDGLADGSRVVIRYAPVEG